jgi:3-isopropylmalate dehydrogenase
MLPGDGIGPEIMKATAVVLDKMNKSYNLKINFEELSIGMTALEATGSTLPDEIMRQIKSADGVILGPCDSYAYPPREEGGINPSAAIRLELDLFANIRPSRARDGVPAMTPDMDLVIVRENTEGFYADRNMYSGSGEFMPTQDVALAVRKVTRQGSRRIAEEAFKLAVQRRKKVTVVTKANVLKLSEGLFLEEVRSVAKSFPGVELREVLIDAMAALLVRTPAEFDVIVTTNMFGDILSDEAAELSGGLGLGGSVNAGANHGIAQAAHGSAPDISGLGIGNPAALMNSVAMLLEWLGGRNGRDDLLKAAKVFTDAIDKALEDPVNHTPDLGGIAKTHEVGKAVANHIPNY